MPKVQKYKNEIYRYLESKGIDTRDIAVKAKVIMTEDDYSTDLNLEPYTICFRVFSKTKRSNYTKEGMYSGPFVYQINLKGRGYTFEEQAACIEREYPIHIKNGLDSAIEEGTFDK